MKKVNFFPFTEKIKRKFFFFFGRYQKYFISRVERTREIADIFNTFDEIYLAFTSKKVNTLYLFFVLMFARLVHELSLLSAP